jgi:cell division protease FtsH
MATKWGLSDELGPVMYGEEEDEVFIGRSVTQHKSVSNETARKIDEVVRTILDRAYARSKELLTTNIDKLHVMAEALLQYETIDARQIDDIMNGREPGPPADWQKPGSTPPPPPPRGDAGSAPDKVGKPATQL